MPDVGFCSSCAGVQDGAMASIGIGAQSANNQGRLNSTLGVMDLISGPQFF